MLNIDKKERERLIRNNRYAIIILTVPLVIGLFGIIWMCSTLGWNTEIFEIAEHRVTALEFLIGSFIVGILSLSGLVSLFGGSMNKLKREEEEEKKKELEPLEILRKSFAEGKISKEDYLERQKILETETKKK